MGHAGLRCRGHGRSGRWQRFQRCQADVRQGDDRRVAFDRLELGRGARTACEKQGVVPAQQDSRAVAWGLTSEYDDTALPAEHDGDLSAVTAEEDQVPAQQDSRAVAWGLTPEHDDTALPAEHDGGPETASAADQTLEDARGDQEQSDAPAGAGDQPDDSPGEPAAPPDITVAEHADDTPADTTERISELNDRISEQDEQMAKVKAENAELRTALQQVQVRLERLENANQDKPVPDLDDLEIKTVQQGPVRTENPKKGRHWYQYIPTNEGLGLGSGTALGAAATVAEIVSPGLASEFGIAAAGVGIAAAAIPWWRARMEAKNDRRTED